MPKVQIIIPAINLWDQYTKQAIESIKTKYPHRILLIDNASTDKTRDEASKLVSETFAHKRNEERWGCAQSWNWGVKDAFERGYDYALILNNDIILHPEAIDRLVERFEQSRRDLLIDIDDAGEEKAMPEFDCLAIVTCMNIAGECPNPMDVKTKNAADYEIVSEAEHPDFSAFMISKEAYEKIGAFDEEFKPAYFEDNDYHYRINLAGMRAIVVPPALYFHFGSRTQNQANESGAPIVTSPKFERNRDYYVQKWGGVPGQEKWSTPFGESKPLHGSEVLNG